MLKNGRSLREKSLRVLGASHKLVEKSQFDLIGCQASWFGPVCLEQPATSAVAQNPIPSGLRTKRGNRWLDAYIFIC